MAGNTWHEGVVRILLILLERKGVNIYIAGEDNRTPLSIAAENVHEAIIEMLLDGHCNPHTPHRYGQTPLSLAERNGHDWIVGWLLFHKS